jgi:predicted transcriptional regulator of viral defense system
MNIRTKLKKYAFAPFSVQMMHDVLADYKRPNDKISELLASGALVAIKRGLYVAGEEMDLPHVEPFLIANHLRGPSYISLESALSYWGLIPERVSEFSSVTLKTSQVFRTPIGRFSFTHLDPPYYALGIQNIALKSNQNVLIASLEKALCDKIVLTSNINLRSVKLAKSWLLDDMRMDAELLKLMDTDKMTSWLELAPKAQSIEILIKTLKKL